jgi:hypothetical protein
LPESLAQHGDLNREIALLNRRVRPACVYQLSLGEHFTGPSKQCTEEEDTPVSDRNRLARAEEHVAVRIKKKRAETELLPRHCRFSSALETFRNLFGAASMHSPLYYFAPP